MVTDDGRVKVLDFGLAKLAGGFAENDAATEVPDRGEDCRGRDCRYPGTTCFPNRRMGEVVDARSDIFSLGIVFYEMLTGRRPFAGNTERDPGVDHQGYPARSFRAQPGTASGTDQTCTHLSVEGPIAPLYERGPHPERVGRVETRARLRRVADWRPGHTGSLRIEHAPALDRGPGRTPRRGRGLEVEATCGDRSSSASKSAAIDRCGRGRKPPDMVARRWAHCLRLGSGRIWVPTGGSATNFTADHRGADSDPAWSPDGGQIAFVSERDGGGIYVMPAIGGPANRISPRASAEGLLSPQWSSDGAELAHIR